MQTVRLPRGLLDQIEKHCRQFIWSGSQVNRKPSLVDWNSVCAPRSRGGLGVKQLREMNDALIMKLAWRFLTESSALWCRVLQCKYGVDLQCFPETLYPKNGSQVWKAICEVWGDLRAGIKWIIGNGKRVRFWLDIWATEKPLVAYLSGSLEGNLEELVCNFVDADGRWNWNLFANLLPCSCILTIAAIRPPWENGEDDTFVWASSTSGNFSVKSAYQFLMASAWHEEDQAWSVIWKWKGPQRIKTFLWLALKERLLTKKELARRHITAEDVCEQCGLESESILHVLRDCFLARQTWLKLIPGRCRERFFSLSFKDWFIANLSNKLGIEHSVEWEYIFGVGVWRLWHWRNETVLTGKDSVELKRSQDIWDRAAEIGKIPVLQRHLHLSKEPQEIQVNWIRPVGSCMKINTDGAVDASYGVATAGGLIRDLNGDWKGGFMFNIGSCDVNGAELWGILMGLDLAWTLNYRCIELEADNKVVVENILGRVKSLEVHKPMISSIQDLLKRDWQVSVKHVYRQANSAADMLAKRARALPLGSHFFEDPPDFLRSQLDDDKNGCPVFRVVNS